MEMVATAAHFKHPVPTCILHKEMLWIVYIRGLKNNVEMQGVAEFITSILLENGPEAF